ncbi:GGDEF domain-containing protein [Halomonas cupida]|uniref:GGDEF domain-containing protein n=1 Tax=Halomonas cupida TaxID=44933 RepID=UPI003A8CAA9C
MRETLFAAHISRDKPQRVRSQDYLKFFLIHWSSILGAITHLSFIALFLAYDHPWLAALNVISVLMWLGALVANYRGNHNQAVYLIASEAGIHAAIMAMTLGTGAGFHYYLLPLSCLVTLSPNMPRWRSVLIGLLGMCEFMVLERLPVDAVPLATASNLPPLAATVNLAVALTVMVLFAMLVRSVYEMQSRSLTSMATRDALTGLFNRRFASDYLRQTSMQQQRNKSPCSVALLDIDHFKHINDRYGHKVGDACLVQVASKLSKHFRSSDVLCRWGGEEFLLIFSDASVDEILPVIESFRQYLHNHPIQHYGALIPLTMSIGVTNLPPGVPFDVVINRADRLLYRAKATGRNRIISQHVDARQDIVETNPDQSLAAGDQVH